MKNYNIQCTLALFALLASSALTANVLEISNDSQYQQHILNRQGPAIIKFSANWCGVCQSIRKPFEELADEAEFKDSVLFASVDVDSMENLSKQNSIIGVPTFLYVRNGQKKGQDIGVQDMDKFKENMRGNIEKNLQPDGEDAGMSQQAPAPEKKGIPWGDMFARAKAIFFLVLSKLRELIIWLCQNIIKLLGG